VSADHETPLEALLRSRRSVRRFEASPPSDAVIERVLELGTLAPSASNKQPWRFIVVARRETIAAMAAAVRAAVERVASHVPSESLEAFRAYGEYFTRFEDAPIVIVPIHRGHAVLSHLVGETIDADLREVIRAMERDSGLVGASLALMSLLLAAHESGLGASAMTGPLLAEPALRELLSVPESWGIVALVPIGIPAELPRRTERKPVAKVARWVR
jgi:nitroreductase